MSDETTSEQPVAGPAAVPHDRAFAVGIGVVGVAALVLVSVTADDRALVPVLLALAIGTGLGWAFLTRALTRRFEPTLDERPAVAAPDHVGTSPTRVGLLHGVVGGLVLVVVLAALTTWIGEYQPSFLWGFIPGSAVLALLQARDTERWERRTGRVVHLRRGARRWAWTRAQARARLVTVPGRTD